MRKCKAKKDYSHVIKQKSRCGVRVKELDLNAFHQLSEKEKIEVIHFNAECCLNCYMQRTAILFRNLGDGFTKMGSLDEFRPSNTNGISDPTASVAIKRIAISEGKLEDAYAYGENKKIDLLIELERSLKLYEDILSLYDDVTRFTLLKRMQGWTYERISDELNMAINTLRQCVCGSKEFLDEYYEEVIEMISLRK